MAEFRRKRSPSARGRSALLYATIAWALGCLLVLLWWVASYRAVVQRLGEWQFATFHRYYPSLTTAILLLLALILAGCLAMLRAMRRRRADRAAGGVGPLVRLARAASSAERGRLFFLSVAVVSGVVAAAVFLSILWLPTGGGAIRTISGVAGSVQPEGAAAFARPLRHGPIARLEENVGLARRVLYVAPVHLADRQGNGGFLTTLDRRPGPSARFVPIASGILVERGLPRELVNLYRSTGIALPERTYLLMRDSGTVRWRAVVLGVQVALLSLLSLVMALLFRRQSRRLARLLRAVQVEPGAAATPL